jgi:hypothetical protein
MIAQLCRYGFASHTAKVFFAMFEAAAYQDLRRLPELFCGFIRKPHRGPTTLLLARRKRGLAASFALLGHVFGAES